MLHLYCTCTSDMRHLWQYLTKASVSSKYIVELESIKSNNNDILN